MGTDLAVLRTDLGKMEGQFALALPEHITPDRFARIIMTAVSRNNALLKCNKQSILAACMHAAQDGLLPDGREGALVPYKANVQWIPMYQGILKKVRNSGELKSLTCLVVYEADEFDYRVINGVETINHVPAAPKDEKDRGDYIRAYAIAHTKDGGTYMEVMSRADINKIKKMSKASRDDSPWKVWEEEMVKKTVIRRLSKKLPMSTDLDTTIRRNDNLIDLSTQEYRETQAPKGLSRTETTQTALQSFETEEAPEHDEETGEIVEGEATETKAKKETPQKEEKPKEAKKPAERKKLSPFEQGKAAFSKGMGAQVNPYKEGDDNRQPWLDGWNESFNEDAENNGDGEANEQADDDTGDGDAQ